MVLNGCTQWRVAEMHSSGGYAETKAREKQAYIQKLPGALAVRERFEFAGGSLRALRFFQFALIVLALLFYNYRTILIVKTIRFDPKRLLIF